MAIIATTNSKTSIPVELLSQSTFAVWAKRQPKPVITWLGAHDFKAMAGDFCVLSDESGKPVRVVAGISEPPSLWDIADFSRKLPKGIYRLEWQGSAAFHEWLCLGWVLGSYKYTRYKKSPKAGAQLILPKGCDKVKIERYAEALFLARDLINTPAEDLGPAELAAAIVKTGKEFGAKVTQIIGDDLLKKNYPAIHRVGRASVNPPRLVDLTWGNPKHPRVTLVGKGVCFDTGGLDLKPSSGMYIMKKDMGGAATALAIARMIMDAKLPVRLRLLVPAVENAVAGNAYRPSDVITMRNGMTVEVGNTDAEGRLILADALAEAITENPKMLIDFSTLTGAARTAVGTDISAMFCNDDVLAEEVSIKGFQMEDPVWRLPLHKAYDKMLDSSIADMTSAPNSPYAGAITAALFLQRFIGNARSWAHFDFMAWNPSSRAGRPEGGEAMAVRAVFRVIQERFGKT
jgi:leucyl aminopeptidase